jgi:hypothetical protein
MVMKWQFYKTISLQDIQLAEEQVEKWQVDKIASSQNGKLTK